MGVYCIDLSTGSVTGIMGRGEPLCWDGIIIAYTLINTRGKVPLLNYISSLQVSKYVIKKPDEIPSVKSRLSVWLTFGTNANQSKMAITPAKSSGTVK